MVRPESTVFALVSNKAPVPDLTSVMARLEKSSAIASVELAEHPAPNAQFALHCTDEEGRSAQVFLTHTPALPTDPQSKWSMGVVLDLGDAPLRDFHWQLQLALIAVPDLVGVYDSDSMMMHPHAWVQTTVEEDLHPAPTALFSIHHVASDDDKTVWLHTHGLERAGAIELDMLDVPAESAPLFAKLINGCAAMVLERGTPDPSTPIEVGQGISLAVLPWQQGVRRVGANTVGGPQDRDEVHQGHRGVLFAMGKRFFFRRLRPVATLLPMLEGDPVLYHSEHETLRMAKVARLRLDRFRTLFDEHAGNTDWQFLVKLGFSVDGKDMQREHLWFEVHHLTEGEVEGTLVNTPLGVAMEQGHRDTHSLERLSDWVVLCDQGRIGPESSLIDEGQPE